MHIARAGLLVDPALVKLLEEEVFPFVGFDPDRFWSGAAEILKRLSPRNRDLLETRDRLQAELDVWFRRHRVRSSAASQAEHLRRIGYLAPEPPPFRIETVGVDDEIATRCGPQLVVPVLNGRFLLNAANARWGSLYDALYGTDALPGPPRSGAYDAVRGAKVIAWAKAHLDDVVPLAGGRHSEVKAYRVEAGRLEPALVEAEVFVGFRGSPDAPTAILLRRHGLHIELQIDRNHPIGRDDPAGVKDILLESALTTIVDFEDSIAAVDGADKTQAYRNWFKLLRGDLEATFEKEGQRFTRRLNEDRVYSDPGGRPMTLPGRSLLLVRNVGHLMTTSAVLLEDGAEAPEGIVDAVVTGLIGLVDFRGLAKHPNSRQGSLYIVKPKMHGPEEVAFANELFLSVETLLDLPRHTLKIGVMDEERRTSINLAACIAAVKQRIVFVNTGFLDRTGDEIHSVMEAGPVVRKGDMKQTSWIDVYERRNVQVALSCGFSGRAQIGKGMWATPDRMADMLVQKIAHPRAGASTAWVPSPTAATLHAVHYHKVDVFARQRALEAEPRLGSEGLMEPPIADPSTWTPLDIRDEVENNVQGILGYVVRWVDQGVGCSKVPDIHDVGLMEDRATLRISSQHVANWLRHGVCQPEEVEAALRRMASKVDHQNGDDPTYEPMAASPESNLAFNAARTLIFEGLSAPNGYTEPTLHAYRRRAKGSLRRESA